jgi:hypothetical protein
VSAKTEEAVDKKPIHPREVARKVERPNGTDIGIRGRDLRRTVGAIRIGGGVVRWIHGRLRRIGWRTIIVGNDRGGARMAGDVHQRRGNEHGIIIREIHRRIRRIVRRPTRIIHRDGRKEKGVICDVHLDWQPVGLSSNHNLSTPEVSGAAGRRSKKNDSIEGSGRRSERLGKFTKAKIYTGGGERFCLSRTS